MGVGGEGRRGEAAPCPECRAGLRSPEGRQGGRQALLGVGKRSKCQIASVSRNNDKEGRRVVGFVRELNVKFA